MTPDAERVWQHPWLRVELAIRSILADRLTRGGNDATDTALARVLEERGRIERAGWFG